MLIWESPMLRLTFTENKDLEDLVSALTDLQKEILDGKKKLPMALVLTQQENMPQEEIVGGQLGPAPSDKEQINGEPKK